LKSPSRDDIDRLAPSNIPRSAVGGRREFDERASHDRDVAATAVPVWRCAAGRVEIEPSPIDLDQVLNDIRGMGTLEQDQARHPGEQLTIRNERRCVHSSCIARQFPAAPAPRSRVFSGSHTIELDLLAQGSH
jgi:hypothetical protein